MYSPLLLPCPAVATPVFGTLRGQTGGPGAVRVSSTASGTTSHGQRHAGAPVPKAAAPSHKMIWTGVLIAEPLAASGRFAA